MVWYHMYVQYVCMYLTYLYTLCIVHAYMFTSCGEIGSRHASYNVFRFIITRCTASNQATLDSDLNLVND
jgi:hypothetical protein